MERNVAWNDLDAREEAYCKLKIEFRFAPISNIDMQLNLYFPNVTNSALKLVQIPSYGYNFEQAKIHYFKQHSHFQGKVLADDELWIMYD